MNTNKLEKIVNLAKRRGFIFQDSEIYGGLSGFWDYGPLGVVLKNNIKKSWWQKFVSSRDDIYPIETTVIMSPQVWRSSGHLKEFADLLVECKKCHKRFRADHLQEKNCPECQGSLTKAKKFNTMFKTFVGPVEEDASTAYLRPENAQGIFVNFKNIIDSYHPRIPFGIAQIGKVFRNEITPSNFIFRTREYELMEFEYFIKEKEWLGWFEFWLKETYSWLESIGIKKSNLKDVNLSKEERAHYSKKTVDIYYNFPFGQDELCALAYRGEYDLKNHSLSYLDEETKKRFIPHVIEPTFGVDRLVLALLTQAYQEDEVKGEKRVFLKLLPQLSPIKIGVFPLLANKENLVKKAKEVYQLLRPNFPAMFDDIGNIGKRYRRQDEIGTPWCVTIDFQTLEDETVTVRDRDTLEQKRVKIKELKDYISIRL